MKGENDTFVKSIPSYKRKLAQDTNAFHFCLSGKMPCLEPCKKVNKENKKKLFHIKLIKEVCDIFCQSLIMISDASNFIESLGSESV